MLNTNNMIKLAELFAIQQVIQLDLCTMHRPLLSFAGTQHLLEIPTISLLVLLRICVNLDIQHTLIAYPLLPCCCCCDS